MKTRELRLEPLEWIRGPAEVRGDLVVLDGDQLESYWPISQHGLAFELAGASTPERIAAFVQRWGLLRHGDPKRELSEPFSDFESLASRFHALWTTYVVLQQASQDEQEALEMLRDLRNALATQFERPAASDDELKYQAAKWIAWTVSEGLEGVGTGLDASVSYRGPEGETFEPDSFALSVRANDLVGYAFHHAAMIMNRSTPARRCEECRRVFEVTHQRQRYCDEKCAGRARYRRWAEKRKAEG